MDGGQAHLHRVDLKEKLYDRRCRVYYAVMDLWERLGNNEAVDERQFALEVHPATHLFGPEVERYLSQIKHRLWVIAGECKAAEKTRLRAELRKYIAHDYEVIFDPYLELHDDKSWFVYFKSRIERWMVAEEGKLASRYERGQHTSIEGINGEL